MSRRFLSELHPGQTLLKIITIAKQNPSSSSRVFRAPSIDAYRRRDWAGVFNTVERLRRDCRAFSSNNYRNNGGREKIFLVGAPFSLASAPFRTPIDDRWSSYSGSSLLFLIRFCRSRLSLLSSLRCVSRFSLHHTLHCCFIAGGGSITNPR